MQTTQEIFTDLIDDPQNPMRLEIDRAGLFELADNIKQNGLINPITVRPLSNRYEVVAGHRRLAACRIAGIIKIPCVVRELNDEQVFSIMTAENLEREDVSLLDECRHYLNAIQRFNKSVTEVAKATRRSEAYVRSRLAIAEMPDYLQFALQEDAIKLGVALALAEITDEDVRRQWVGLAIRDGISVAQAEFWVQGWRVNRLPGGNVTQAPPSGDGVQSVPVVMFECAIDGMKYDARLCKSLIIYEGNLEIFNAIVKELRAPESEIPSGRANERGREGETAAAPE